MIEKLIDTFCRYELQMFVIRHKRNDVIEEQILKPYFRHFIYFDVFNNEIKIEEHRHPSISYLLKVNGFERKMNFIEHFLLKKYIKQNFFND